MDATWRKIMREQFGASIDMLENAIKACPDQLWGDGARQTQFWYLAYHTLFFLDLCCSASLDTFTPPAPFTLSELDPTGALPDRVHTKTEVLAYLEHGRNKARAQIEGLTAANSTEQCRFEWIELTRSESVLYNMRHVQHHAAQLNLLLRQAGSPVRRWVRRTEARDI
jgi:DinB family protein